MRRSHLTREIVELVVIILVLFVVIRYVIHGYQMGSNMEPTIKTNSSVMVNRLSYLFGQPHRGDAIVFHYPLNVGQDSIARIIGLPGDHIKTDSTHVWVNGVLLNEPYVHTPFNPEGREWVVPIHMYFVMNDNRQVGDDSRNWGPLNQDNIIGKAVLVYWPSNDWQLVSSYPDVFSQVK